MISFIFNIILLLIIFVLIYFIRLALRRITVYESSLLDIQNIIRYMDEKLKMIDHTGHFESDDEVGFFFEEIKKMQDGLNELFIIEGQDDESNNEEKNNSEKTS